MAYDLDEATVRRLTAAALATHADRSGRFLALAVAATSPLADVARTVERQVYEPAFGMDHSVMTGAYRRYEDDSLFFVVLDRRAGLPAGAARVIDGGGKTLDDAPRHIGVNLSTIVTLHGLDNGRIWDFAPLAVLPAYRGGRFGPVVSSLLYRAFLNAGRLAGVRHVVALLDPRTHRSLELLGVRMTPMAGSEAFAYLGTPGTEALHTMFAGLVPSITRHAGHLRGGGEPFPGRGLRRVLARRGAARVARRVASGDGLDENIVLPGLDRRRLVRQL